jgi:hypothetical protein
MNNGKPCDKNDFACKMDLNFKSDDYSKDNCSKDNYSRNDCDFRGDHNFKDKYNNNYSNSNSVDKNDHYDLPLTLYSPEKKSQINKGESYFQKAANTYVRTDNCFGNVDYVPYLPTDKLKVTPSDNLTKAVGGAAIGGIFGLPLGYKLFGATIGSALFCDLVDRKSPFDIKLTGHQDHNSDSDS